MNDDERFAGYGAYLYGALYLTLVFAAGLHAGESLTMKLAAAAAGFSYVTQVAIALVAGGVLSHRLIWPLWLVTVALGGAAGLSLLVRI